MDEKLTPPKRTRGDAAHALAKAALSVVPAIGGPAVEIFQYVVQPPLERRRDQWMREVGARLEALEANGLDLESLQQNERFISAVLQASQAALKTHSTGKLIALQNAIANVARGQTPDETIQHLLLAFVDELSEMHLRVLKVFDAPAAPAGMSIGGLGVVLEHNIPELRGREELYRQLWRDLHIRGLLNTPDMNLTISGSSLAQRRTTVLGHDLLRFVSDG